MSYAFVNKEQKSHLMNIYEAHRYSFFCDQPFFSNGEVSIQNCKHCPSIKSLITWMPIVSQRELAKTKMCFQEKVCVNRKGLRFKGVRCCQEIDENFQRMNKDLYNYVPELNIFIKQRGNYHFGLIPQNEHPAKGCHFYVDKKNKIVEPAPQLRGIIARTYLYMRDTYQLALTSDELRLYQAWHQQYPVTDWERERSDKIKAKQAKGNPYVK
jgi:deoxyribonuclease-1